MRYGSVCSGIEAATVAWRPLGWECAFVSEIDAFPNAVLAHHYPGVTNYGDFTKINTRTAPAIDLLVGGTPCQSFSVAGLRKGMADPRGNLALAYLRLVDGLRPRWVVWENVPGVLSSSKGRDFGAFVGALGELGYGWAYRVLDAQYFGVPQRRRRVFVVGHLGDWRPAVAVLFEHQSMRGDSPPCREARQGPPPSPTLRANGGRGSRQDKHPLTVAQAGEGQETHAPTVANVLTRRMDKGINSSVDEGQTLIASMRESGQGFWTEDDQAGTVDSSDVHRPAVLAFALRSDAARDGEARTPSPDAEGRVRLRDPGFSVGEELAPTVDAGQPHTVAFVPDVAYALTGGPGGNQFGTGRDSQDTFVTEAYQCQGTNVGRMGTLRSGNGNEAGGVPFVVHSLTRRHDSSEDGCGRGVPLVPEVTGALNSAGGKSAGSATAQDAAGGLLVPETAATIGERMRGQDDSCADNLLPIAFMDTESHSSGACNRDLAPTVKTDTGRVAIAFYSNQGGQDKVTADGQSPPVKIGSGSGVSPVAVAFTCKDHGQDVGQDVSPTLRSMGERDSTPCGGGQVAVAIGMDEEYNADEELMGTIRSHQSGGFEGAVAFQLSGDRDKPGVSASREVAFALSANPMSDRGQAVLAFDTQQVTCPDNHSNPLPGDPSPTLSRRAGETMMIAFSTCGYGAHEGDVVPPLMASDAQLSNHVTGVIGFERRIGRNGRGQPSDTTSPLRAVGVQGDAAPAVAFTVADNSNAHAWEKDTAPTLEAHPQSETSGRQTGVRTGMQVRRLTPRECERLQGFPDDYTLIPYRNKSLEIDGKEYRGKIKYAADGPRYKALGNSMAVPVMRWIGERIAAVDAALPGKKGK